MFRKLYEMAGDKLIKLLVNKNRIVKKGQTQVEWFLIIALIAAVIIAVFAIFGNQILSWVKSVLGTVTGYTGTTY